MEFDEWKPLYDEILSDFGYSKGKDRRAARLLAESRGSDDLSSLSRLKSRKIEIGGPYYLYEDGDRFSIAAGSALTRMLEEGTEPDLIVTDMDGDTDLQREMNLDGVPIVIHAHGDNIQLIKEWATKFKGHVISTCQCKPPNENIYNFGGFTDGDRAAFIADQFGGEKIILNGWDFENPCPESEIKKEKLKWAKRLLHHIDIPVIYRK